VTFFICPAMELLAGMRLSGSLQLSCDGPESEGQHDVRKIDKSLATIDLANALSN
jgi:hypothetical protein